MLQLYDLLETVLQNIENELKDDVNEHTLAERISFSSVHLRRLFKYAFGRTIGAYIRSRKLASSIEELHNNGKSILEIAKVYGFEYEQTYIRSFKREFELTPGELRKSGQIIKIEPPLHLFDSNRLGDGIIFGPDIVLVPEFFVVGKRHKSPFRDAVAFDPEKAIHFCNNDKMLIPNVINPDFHINISREAERDASYSWFMPSLQVKSLDNTPEGFDSDTFPSSLCANFRFAGPADIELNMAVADGMFKAIDDFMGNEYQRYFLDKKRVNFEILNTFAQDRFFNIWEWYAPVIEKTKVHAPPFCDGIVNTTRQKFPALRFIGKKYTEPLDYSVFDKVLVNLDNWRLNYGFDPILEQSILGSETVYKEGNSYISLMRRKDDGFFEYWLGMFVPKGAAIPHGYEMIDFPESGLGVCSVYGKRNSIIHYDTLCREKLAEADICQKINTQTSEWFFQRYCWQKFFEDDRYGKRILEYCYFL